MVLLKKTKQFLRLACQTAFFFSFLFLTLEFVAGQLIVIQINLLLSSFDYH